MIIDLVEMYAEFSSFTINIEMWLLENNIERAKITRLLQVLSTRTVTLEPQTVKFASKFTRIAQQAANENRCRVVLAVSGEHKRKGKIRNELGAFYPQIFTNKFRTPESTVYMWPDGHVTRQLIPEPPEGYKLMIVQLENKHPAFNKMEFFVAYPAEKTPVLKNHGALEGEYTIVKNPWDVVLAPGDYIFKDDAWTVASGKWEDDL